MQRWYQIWSCDNLSPYIRISSCPYIHKHDGEGLAQEKQIHKEGESYHGDGAEEKHHDEVWRLSPKTALFKHPGKHAVIFYEF